MVGLNPFFQKAFFITNNLLFNMVIIMTTVSILFFRRLFSSEEKAAMVNRQVSQSFFSEGFFHQGKGRIWNEYLFEQSLNPFFQKAFFIYVSKRVNSGVRIGDVSILFFRRLFSSTKIMPLIMPVNASQSFFSEGFFHLQEAKNYLLTGYK